MNTIEKIAGAVVVGADGRRIEMGDTVRLAGNALKLADREAMGIVIDCTEPDGDADDEGRAISIAPRITVRFFDGIEDTFIVSMRFMHDDLRCEDILRAAPVSPARRAWWALRRAVPS